jgi:hypothetical protein
MLSHATLSMENVRLGRTLIFYLEPMKLIDGDWIFLSLIPGIVIQK